VTGINQEIVSGQQESFFYTTNIPDNILTAFYTTMARSWSFATTTAEQSNTYTRLLALTYA